MSDSESWVDELKPASPDGATIISAERARSNVPIEPLTTHLLGQDFLERQRRILPLLQNDPLFSKKNQANLGRPERYSLGLARAKRLRQMAEKHGWDDEEHEMAKYLSDDVSPYQLHQTMFRQTLLEQTSPEQKEYWMGLHQTWSIIGAYAQTELGHGSNVRGIELTARWDPGTREFILHSPTLTASKWWNGSLGRTATHSIVVAQLLLPEKGSESGYKSYGPHLFVTRVRDADTHLPLPGIVIGDIGPKYGYASMDNAYMLFNNFRIPHSAMLSRYSRIDPDTGKYHKPENPAVAYGSMTHARKRIIMAARLVLARAVTVAIRYCSIRRQFRDRDSVDPGETSVLDYPTVQIRLLPLLATTYALHYTGKKMGQIYDATRSQVDRGDLSGLIDLHSLSSGLKSLASELSAGGIETCRRSMGGHGFGGGSGLVQLNADYLSKPTVEGDNWMITQQMARYLIRKADLIATAKGPFHPSNTTEAVLHDYHSHIKEGHSKGAHQIYDGDSEIVEAFAHRASHLAFKAYAAHNVNHRSWNSLLIQLHELSHAQSEFIMVSNFREGLAAASDLSIATRSVLQANFRLFALHTMHKSSRQFARCGAVSEEDVDSLPDRILSLMHEIRPHAVQLVDAWGIPDYLLDSALGRSDGRVYEDLFHRAHRLNPLNKVTFNPDWRTDEIVKGSRDAGDILTKL